MTNLCIIPARGGSKRIPRKNIKEFLGKPILAYSIELAQKSGLFEEVIVSTDSEEIAAIANQYGAKTPFMRSNENADDFATLSDVVEEVSDFYKMKSRPFDNICLILPTAPLLNVEILSEGLSFLESHSKLCSVKPIVKFSYPIQRALKLNKSTAEVEMINPEHKTTRSQDLMETYHDAGSFYWMKFDKGLKTEPKGGFEISPIYVQDIDTEEDWQMAEFKYSYLNES